MSKKTRSSVVKLIFNKFDLIPFETLCCFLFVDDMFKLLRASKVIRVKVYKAGSSHATVNDYKIAQRLMATFPKISLYTPEDFTRYENIAIMTLTRLVSLSFHTAWTGLDYNEPFYAQLKYLTNLTKLSFSVNGPNGDSIVQLPKLKILEMYHNSTITDAHIKMVTTLTEFSIDNCKLSDEGLMYLTNLKRLDLSNNKNITGKFLTALTQLNSLRLGWHNDTLDCMNLIGLTCLRELVISGPSIETHILVQLTFLEKLSICVTVHGFDDIALLNLQRLTSLSVTGNSALSGNTLCKLVGLRHLRLQCTEIEGKYLRKLSLLSHLEIGNNAHIKGHLSGLTAVTNLVLFSDNMAFHRGFGGLKNVEVISIDSYRIFMITIKDFLRFKKLKRIIARKNFLEMLGGTDLLLEKRKIEIVLMEE
ncbi:MAG: hypothetical protein Hyperionvirus2_172 [Hyperionvirus sp.]|uniref:Leucine-rich repeat protein n=1 Tax=Hyperionvirus sp. TaxID=2487770 RepID=A0A3G5A8G4_9VIRU|nr:MAG: hypothetical protein Hyperionvirus2_172 [Hyperionvirus sp.]